MTTSAPERRSSRKVGAWDARETGEETASRGKGENGALLLAGKRQIKRDLVRTVFDGNFSRQLGDVPGIGDVECANLLTRRSR